MPWPPCREQSGVGGRFQNIEINGYTVSTLSGAEASEKKPEGREGPQLMHIATHGYFLADGDVGSRGAAGVNAENAKGNPCCARLVAGGRLADAEARHSRFAATTTGCLPPMRP